MEQSMIIAGFGGQGVMLTGKILGYAATEHKKKAVFLPSYGTQQRGGTASCNLIISDGEVGCPIIGKADILMIFNQPSMDAFLGRLKPGGKLFMNSTLCHVPENIDKSIEVYALPVDDLARELGSQQVANIIMLGAMATVTGMFQIEELNETLQHSLAGKEKMWPVNEAALKKGAELVK